MKKTREANERSSEELRKGLFSCLPVRGHSIFTWILLLPFLTAYLPWRGQFLTRKWTKIGAYWPPTHVNLSTSFLNDHWLLLLVNCGVSRTINHWFWTFWSSSESLSFQAFPLEICEIESILLSHSKLSIFLDILILVRKMQAQSQLQNTKILLTNRSKLYHQLVWNSTTVKTSLENTTLHVVLGMVMPPWVLLWLLLSSYAAANTLTTTITSEHINTARINFNYVVFSPQDTITYL